MNKVNTKVDMRFKLDEVDWLQEEIREAVRQAVRKPTRQLLRGATFVFAKADCTRWPRIRCGGAAHCQANSLPMRALLQEKRRVNKDGEFVITSQRTRSQA